MKAQNIADLEYRLLATGWAVDSDAFVDRQPTPGVVTTGGYRVQLVDTEGQGFVGVGSTRTDALRAAADSAGLLSAGEPLLK